METTFGASTQLVEDEKRINSSLSISGSEKKLMAKITIIENIKNDKKALTFIAATRGARGFNSSKARKKLMI